jgi:hypothetical protein
VKLTYPGPHEAVEVPALGRVVKRDESVEVDSPLAEQLVAQGWKPEPTKARKGTVKKEAT